MIEAKFVYKESFENNRNVGSEGCLMRVSIPGAEPKNSRKLHPRPFFPNNPSMFLEQICPGQVNPEPHAIDTFIWNSIRYIVRKHNFNSTLFLIVDGTPKGLCYRVQSRRLCRSSKTRANHCFATRK